jgi:hypothetical protein
MDSEIRREETDRKFDEYSDARQEAAIMFRSAAFMSPERRRADFSYGI